MTDELSVQINNILHELRPFIQADGGDIEFVSFNDNIVTIRLHGACVSCPMSLYTVKLGIQERLVQQIPQIREVIAI